MKHRSMCATLSLGRVGSAILGRVEATSPFRHHLSARSVWLLLGLLLATGGLPLLSATSVQAAPDPPALAAVQQAELTASDAVQNDGFGDTVALSGDTALVGCPGETVSGYTDAGAAYVYTRSGTNWTQQAELDDPQPAVGEQFGDSVALDGDTALVGEYFKTINGQIEAGAVYVYTRTGETWAYQAELSSGVAGDYFGSGMALDGDTALVGATLRGYIYVRSGTTWTQQAELSDPDPAAGAFGYSSVALSGGTAVIGAPAANGNGWYEAGAAYVFVRSGTTWTQQVELTASDAVEQDGFGNSVAIDGDTALVGCSNKTFGAGAAYVYTRSGTNWTQQAELDDPNPFYWEPSGESGDSFGNSVALSGDTALIGVPRGQPL